MALSRALSRLLRVREIEEEQRKIALDAAQQEMHRLEAARSAASERGRRGRRLLTLSAVNGEVADRLAGIEEIRSSSRHTEVLSGRITESEEMVEFCREEFLVKRVERRQVETLLSEAEVRDAVEADRRGQEGVDSWYGSRLHRAEKQGESARRPEAILPDFSSKPASS